MEEWASLLREAHGAPSSPWNQARSGIPFMQRVWAPEASDRSAGSLPVSLPHTHIPARSHQHHAQSRDVDSRGHWVDPGTKANTEGSA